jgi:hypothetical protein
MNAASAITPQSPESPPPFSPWQPTPYPQSFPPNAGIPPTGPLSTKSKRRRWPLIAGAVVILAAGGAVAGILLLTGKSSTHTVNGTAEIYDASDLGGLSKGDSCVSTIASGGYSDIQPGLAVNVTNQNNTFLSSGTLAGGTIASDGGCAFTFTVSGLPNAKDYGFTVSSRGTVWYTPSELQSNGWAVLLTLGTQGSGTSVPATTVPESTIPDTTIPDTTVPETTVPDTTIPDTTVPTTVP